MFVTLEGPEGSGKSTLLTHLDRALRERGIDALATREPGAGPVGARIREILLHGEDLDPKAELLLFLADRAQHVASVVRPALEAGRLVVCDRFVDSTVVYQGHARGLNLDELRRWNAFVTGGLAPDLTLLLDLPAEAGLARLQSKDRLDAEPLEFHLRVRNGFLEEAAREPERFVILDATAAPEEIAEQAIGAIDRRLAEGRSKGTMGG